MAEEGTEARRDGKTLPSAQSQQGPSLCHQGKEPQGRGSHDTSALQDGEVPQLAAKHVAGIPEMSVELNQVRPHLQMCMGSPRKGTSAKAAGCRSRACPRLTHQYKNPRDRNTASGEVTLTLKRARDIVTPPGCFSQKNPGTLIGDHPTVLFWAYKVSRFILLISGM